MDTFTLSHIVSKGVPICGSTRSQAFLEKLIKEFNIQAEGESIKGKPEYSITTLEKYFQLYQEQDNAGADDMAKERLKKIRLENENLEKDSKRKDLIIEQLKSSLIDVQEMVDFWSQRKAIELAVAKKFTSIDLPIEVPGMTHAQARTKGEEYYNRLIEAYEETDKLVQERFGVEPDKDMIQKLDRVIFGIFKAHEIPISGSVATSGSI